MPINPKNIAWLKTLKVPGVPDFGAKMSEMINDIITGTNNIEQQTNSNAAGPPQPPPAINSLKVTASQGHFSAEIQHHGDFYRSPNYFLVHADNPQFTNPHIVDLGASRNWSDFLGNSNRYFAAYAQYGPSSPGPIVYHGTAAQPTLVQGGGSVPGAIFGTSQGSGTGIPGVAHSGFGPVPFRTTTGGPPVR